MRVLAATVQISLPWSVLGGAAAVSAGYALGRGRRVSANVLAVLLVITLAAAATLVVVDAFASPRSCTLRPGNEPDQCRWSDLRLRWTPFALLVPLLAASAVTVGLKRRA